MNFVPIAIRDLGPANQRIVVNFWTSASFNGGGEGLKQKQISKSLFKIHKLSTKEIQIIQLSNALGGFSGRSAGKEPSCNAGGLGLIPGLGRSPAEGNSYPLQYSGLENCMDRRAWWATIHEVTE